MRAVLTTTPGGPETLRFDEVEDATPKEGEVLIRVRAAALNRADLLQRQGKYPAPPGIPPNILGLEFAGKVRGAPPKGSRFHEGDRVMGICGGGGQAELMASPEGLLMPIPPGLSFEQAAAIPEAFLTAYDALFLQAQLKSGDPVLIHAVASGVGTAAVQLARLAGAVALGTSRSAEKLARVVPLGLQHGVLTGADASFADEVLSFTSGAGVAVLLDLVGASFLAENLKSLANRGTLIQVGTMGGSVGPLDLGVLMRKRLRLIGTVLRARPLDERVALTQRFADSMLLAFSRGELTPIVDRVLPASEVRIAHELLASSSTFGKLVLRF
jgi:putative PIG3 family NAD(P)H quinone oxidoreductase